jgi:hypothetical protein
MLLTFNYLFLLFNLTLLLFTYRKIRAWRLKQEKLRRRNQFSWR